MKLCNAGIVRVAHAKSPHDKVISRSCSLAVKGFDMYQRRRRHEEAI